MSKQNDCSSQIVEDVKWFMFDENIKVISNETGFQHGLKFLTWCGDGESFIVSDSNGDEYRIRVTKEIK